MRELEEEKSRVEEEAGILEQASTYLTITISLPDAQGSVLLRGMLEEAGNRRRRVAQIVSSTCTQYSVHVSLSNLLSSRTTGWLRYRKPPERASARRRVLSSKGWTGR